MRNGRLISFVCAIALLVVPGPLFAHHGQVEYEKQTVTLKGAVTKFEWANPHCILVVAVKNDNDDVEDWYAEFLPPARISRSGWTRDSIKPGDQITLVGRPGKKGAHIMWLKYLVMLDGRKLDRDADTQ